MSLVIPTVAQPNMLNQFLNQFHPYFHLYTVDIALGPDTVLTDFTEPDWSGYAPIRTPTWQPAEIGPPAGTFAQQLTWSRGTGGTATQVFGAYVTALKTTQLLWCFRRPFGPIQMQFLGDLTIVIPSLTLGQMFP